jgi:peptidyl-prolyl cis-trans isomerase A (cyclophilin A)
LAGAFAWTVLALAACDDPKPPPPPDAPVEDERERSAASSKGGAHADLYREAAVPAGKSAKPVVRLKTSAGDVEIVLDRRSAPDTVENFLGYVRDGFYSGVIFDRVVAGVLVKGGGRDQKGAAKAAGPAIRHEGENGLSHKRGTIAMWRGKDPHSAASEFFFNLADNYGAKAGARNFDFQSQNRGPEAWGYTVFGRVKDPASLAVLDRLGAVPTAANPEFPGESSKPVEAPRILSAEIVSE